MKLVWMAALGVGTLLAAASAVDIYSPADLHAMSLKLAAKKSGFASETLEKYTNHYTMLAFRERKGSAEVHKTEADIFVVTEGRSTIVTGGELVNGHEEKPGELRGTSVSGGQSQMLEKGSIIHIPAGTPHQLLIDHGPFTYFVVKVTGQ